MIRRLQPILSKQFKPFNIQKAKFSTNENPQISTDKKVIIIDKKIDMLNEKIDIIMYGFGAITIGYFGGMVLHSLV